MDAFASELFYIAVEADRAGRAAVIDHQGVAILTSTRIARSDGPVYVSYRVDRVQTVAEARNVLRPGSVFASTDPDANGRRVRKLFRSV